MMYGPGRVLASVLTLSHYRFQEKEASGLKLSSSVVMLGLGVLLLLLIQPAWLLG